MVATAAARAELDDRQASRRDLYALMRRLHRQSRRRVERSDQPLSPLPGEAYEQAGEAGWDRDAVARGAWQDGPHLRLLADRVHGALRPGGRLIIQMPPRHGKSQTVSRVLPLFALGRNPWVEVIVGTYGSELSSSFGRYVKAQLGRPEFHSVFPDFKLRGGTSAVDRLETTQGGALVFTGAGGPISGRGARLAVIDDPIKNWEDAASPTMREKLWDWYQSVLRTRLSPDGSVIVLHTRWHPDDLIGRLLRAQADGTGERWDVLSLPALATHDEAYRLSDGGIWVRRQGEALWPCRYDHGQLDVLQRALSERVWSALYQQRPTLGGGKFFDITKVHVVGRHELPWRLLERAPKYLAWDLAIKREDQEAGDYTAAVVACRDHQHRIWVVDIVYGRWGPKETVQRIAELTKRWQPTAAWVEEAQWAGIEPWVQEALRQAPGCVPLVPVKTGGRDKGLRATPLRAVVEHGQLHVVGDLPGWPELRAELDAFGPSGATGGQHDDLIDALAYVVTHSAHMSAHVAQRPDHTRLGSPEFLTGTEFEAAVEQATAAQRGGVDLDSWGSGAQNW